MRSLIGIGLAVAVFGLAAGCGKKAGTSGPGGTAAAPSIEGNWTLVGMEVGGQKLTEKQLADTPAAEKKIKATADKLVKTKGATEDPLTYKIDYTKTPNEIDLTETTAAGKPNTIYGICKLEGDTLTICAVESADPADRPKEFKTAGNQAMIMTLKKD